MPRPSRDLHDVSLRLSSTQLKLHRAAPLFGSTPHSAIDMNHHYKRDLTQPSSSQHHYWRLVHSRPSPFRPCSDWTPYQCIGAVPEPGLTRFRPYLCPELLPASPPSHLRTPNATKNPTPFVLSTTERTSFPFVSCQGNVGFLFNLNP